MVAILLLCILGCSFTKINGQRVRFYPPPPSTQYVFDPSEVTLTWHYKVERLSGQPVVYFYKRNDEEDIRVVSLLGDKMFVSGQYRGRVTAWRNMSVASMTMKNLTSEDYTHYKISVKFIDLSEDAKSFRSLIEGVDPTKPTITCGAQRLVSNVTVAVDDHLNCSCSSTGLPFPTVVWVGSNSSILKKERISRSDAKIYKCVASNPYGSLNESMLYVKVQYPPNVPEITSTSASSFIGQKVSFTCTADGDPAPNYSWTTPDNKTLRSNSNGTLVMLLRNSRQFGVYSCIASNLHGSRTSNVTLRQLFVPGKVRFVSNMTKTFEISLKWSEPDDGGPAIARYYIRLIHDGRVIESKDTVQPQYRKDTLRRNTTYTFCVTAANIVGNGSESCVQLTTLYEGKPSVPAEPKLTLREDMLTVTWDEVDGSPTYYIVEYKMKTDKYWYRPDGHKLTKRKFQFYVSPHEEHHVRILAGNDYGSATGKETVLVVPTSKPSTKTTSTTVQQTKPNKSPTIGSTQKGYQVPGVVSDDMPTTIIIISVLAVMSAVVLVLLFALWLKRRSQGGSCNVRRHQQRLERERTVEHMAAPNGDLYAQVEGKKNKKKPKDERSDLVYAELSDFDPTASGSRVPEPHHTEYADIQHIRPAVSEEPDYEDIPPRVEDVEPPYTSIRELNRTNSIGV